MGRQGIASGFCWQGRALVLPFGVFLPQSWPNEETGSRDSGVKEKVLNAFM